MLKSNMKKVIYFDIDRTLVDSVMIRELTRNGMCRELNLNRETINKIIDEYVSTLDNKNDFNREEMLKHISLKTGVRYDLLKNAHDKPKYYVDALFDDVIPTLTKLKNDGCSLGIFSEGFTDYQMDKLKLSGIYKFFDEDKIIIVRKKLREDVVEKLGEAIVIDDWVEVIDYLKSFPKIKTIWLDRVNEVKLTDLLNEIK